jgi:predicted ArsR family transcriptional regulator
MQLTDKEEQIIFVLATKGFKTYYDLFKKEGISSSTAWKHLDNLTKKGLVEVKKEEAFRIRGRKKKLYGLTFRGLIQALKNENVRLIETQNWQELISSTIRAIKETDSLLRISDIFKLADQERDQKYRDLEDMLIEYIRNHAEETEKFLRHYDLDNSEDYLIFEELTWKVGIGSVAEKIHINGERRRMAEKSLSRLKKKGGKENES